jgi:hypothetical protein
VYFCFDDEKDRYIIVGTDVYNYINRLCPELTLLRQPCCRSIKINVPAKSCVKPMAKSKMKCCKDTKLDVKVKDSHEIQKTSFLPQNHLFLICPRYHPRLIFYCRRSKSMLEKLFDRGPPDTPAKQSTHCIY